MEMSAVGEDMEVCSSANVNADAETNVNTNANTNVNTNSNTNVVNTNANTRIKYSVFLHQVVEINNVVNIDAEDVGNPQLVSLGSVFNH